METDAECLKDEEREFAESPEMARSAWELIDEEWAGRDDAPMCM